MIISASYRTDIPAFYGPWFMNRLCAGEAWVRNPYGSKPYKVSLAPQDVDGFVFWTRNLAPFHQALFAVEDQKRPYIVQYTIIGYPHALETGVPPTAHGISQLRELANARGIAAGVWRYDPILLTSLTPSTWHLKNFADIATQLSGVVDEVTVSFCSIYRKTARNLTAATAKHGFTWHDPTNHEKHALLTDIADIATSHGIRLTICSQPLLTSPGLPGAACIDTERLSRVADRPILARQKGNRPGCLCAESRDIGAYDTCAHGCAYCYAVRDHPRARDAVRSHEPSSMLLK